MGEAGCRDCGIVCWSSGEGERMLQPLRELATPVVDLSRNAPTVLRNKPLILLSQGGHLL
ncbi:MAG: hypothetical protein R2867_32765 [Caldilineaceae bacterium]